MKSEQVAAPRSPKIDPRIAALRRIAVVPAFCIEPQDRGSLRTQSVSHLFGQDRYGLLTRRGEPARTGTRALIELLGRGP